jgi:PAS domain S-box-containing protein
MRALWKPAAVVTVLLVLLVFLLTQSRSPDLDLREHLHESLQTLELRDAELTRDVLLARAGLLPNYDGLAQDRHRLIESITTLQHEAAAGSPAAATLLKPSVQALVASLQQKLVGVEHFKSGDALLRNSIAYLTYGVTSAAPPPSLAPEIGKLSGAFLRLVERPSSESAADFRSSLDRIANAPQKIATLQFVLDHGNLIARLLPQLDETLRQIVQSPTASLTGELQSTVLQYSGKVEQRAQMFRYALFLVSLILLAFLVYQFLGLRRNALQLAAANADLRREATERQQAEAALRGSEERYRAIAESANEAIVTVDKSGLIVSWNPGSHEIFGYTPEEVLGTPFARLVPADCERGAAAPTASVPITAPLLGRTVETVGARKDGSLFPLEASLATWANDQGRFSTAIIRDISARKRLEETTRQQELQLIQANKMTALGTLVSGVAHEINNPNQMVMLNSSLLEDAWRDARALLDEHCDERGDFQLAGLPYAEMRETVAGLIRDVHEGAIRIDRIIADLKDFARPRGHGMRALVNLNDTVQRATRLLAHLISKRCAKLETDLSPDLPGFKGDAQQVEQIVVNLVVNALEALPDRGRKVRIATYQEREELVTLEVSDQGIGIPIENLSRLCDPFFTTKQASGGTGLGLAVTFSLAQANGGRIDFESEPGVGTRARVRFTLVRVGEALVEEANS